MLKLKLKRLQDDLDRTSHYIERLRKEGSDTQIFEAKLNNLKVQIFNIQNTNTNELHV